MAANNKSDTVGVAPWLVTIGAIGLYIAGGKLPLPSVAYEASSLFLPYTGEAQPHPGISVFTLGVRPIIAALSLTELARLAIPSLARWVARGPRQATRYLRIARSLALGVAALQALGVAVGLERADAVFESGWPFQLEVVAAFVGATAVLIWLADLINARGVGDGLVLLFAAPLAAHFPALAANWWKFGVFLPVYVPVLLLALSVLSIAALIAVSRRNSTRGPLDLWSLLLATQIFQAFHVFIMWPWTLFVALVSNLSGGDIAPRWASALDMGGVAFHILASAALFAVVALRRAQLDQTRLEPAAWLLLTVEFVVWTVWWPIAQLAPGTAVYALGFNIVLCVAAALSLLPQWRGGRALAPG
jgi:preprotein translocase subunit SecY